MLITSVAWCPACYDPYPETKQEPVPIKGLVGLWKFDDQSGAIALDASGNENHGVLSGPMRVEDPEGGRGLAFDGVDDVVRVKDSASLDSVTGQVTVFARAYFKPRPNPNISTLVHRQKGETIYENFYLGVSQGAPTFIIDTTTNVTAVIAPLTFKEPIWTELAGTFDGATLRIYVDGSEVASKPVGNATFGADTTELTFGMAYQQATLTEAFEGQLHEVRIYTRALDASEIADL